VIKFGREIHEQVNEAVRPLPTRQAYTEGR
jgi:hypothetical protein